MSHIIMIDEPNGNNLLKPKHPSGVSSSFSNDDMSQSQSISEYTDANESMSCPTEFFAEFLSAVMLKDYKKALKYCKLILEFEPNNVTAKEFYPLIQEKLKLLDMPTSNTMDNLNESSTQDAGEPDDSDDSDDSSSSERSNTDYSCESDDDDDKDPNDGEDEQNHSNMSSNCCTSGSENTTHSYPSSLLEEEEDDLHLMPNLEKLNLSPSLSDLNNGNYKTASTSESESPTEPLTQHIAANMGSMGGEAI